MASVRPPESEVRALDRSATRILSKPEDHLWSARALSMNAWALWKNPKENSDLANQSTHLTPCESDSRQRCGFIIAVQCTTPKSLVAIAEDYVHARYDLEGRHYICDGDQAPEIHPMEFTERASFASSKRSQRRRSLYLGSPCLVIAPGWRIQGSVMADCLLMQSFITSALMCLVVGALTLAFKVNEYRLSGTISETSLTNADASAAKIHHDLGTLGCPIFCNSFIEHCKGFLSGDTLEREVLEGSFYNWVQTTATSHSCAALSLSFLRCVTAKVNRQPNRHLDQYRVEGFQRTSVRRHEY
ncbi:hypothetical protein BU23DRAFT_570365 [Bimuria novae-zelandiae CBS 107.79]|uniref:Uncharacterized protein n=1 Tax=Bimuria novae-zelandiae CBS 107.79 TaxID=1447943 RepID=A0A6A5V3Q3_9PLEO|nr:hypothetical protein BU23DRAFT_570365 [Bimuria novae-zelandiae CBS 107.79]